MITSNLLYQMYIEVLNLKINELLEENISYHTVHNNLIGKLYDYNPYIELCTNYSLNELLEFTDLTKFNKIYFSNDRVYINNELYTKEVLNLYLKNYIDINKIVVRNEQRINKLKSQRLEYQLYYNIIKRFNKGVTDAMIEEGYVFNPGDTFGKLYINKVEYSDEPRVNMPQSMINRRKLLAEGKHPYSAAEAKEYAERGEEYHGIKYFAYYPKVDFLIKWRRGEMIRKYFPFIEEFKYRPPHTDHDSYHAKMRNFIKNNINKALILYDRGEYERT